MSLSNRTRFLWQTWIFKELKWSGKTELPPPREDTVANYLAGREFGYVDPVAVTILCGTSGNSNFSSTEAPLSVAARSFLRFFDEELEAVLQSDATIMACE